MVKQCKVRKGKITPTLNLPSRNKTKTKTNTSKKKLGKNERTTETNRKDQKPETKKDGTYQFSRFYFTLHTKNDFCLCRAVSRTHAQRPGQKKKDSVHPSILPFFLDYITQRGIPPRHKKSYRARNSRPANQPVREREKYIHFVSAISPSTTSSHLSTPHISTPFSTPTPPTRTTTTTTTAIQPTISRCIRPDPVSSSIHSTIRYVTSW